MESAGRTKVTPLFGASVSKLWMNEAVETGGGDFNHLVDETPPYSGVLFAGSDFSGPLSGTAGRRMLLIGFFKLGCNVFADDDNAHSVTATSATFGSFDQAGANMGPVLSTVGLGWRAIQPRASMAGWVLWGRSTPVAVRWGSAANSAGNPGGGCPCRITGRLRVIRGRYAENGRCSEDGSRRAVVGPL